MKRTAKWLLPVAALFTGLKALHVIHRLRHPELTEGCFMGDSVHS